MCARWRGRGPRARTASYVPGAAECRRRGRGGAGARWHAPGRGIGSDRHIRRVAGSGKQVCGRRAPQQRPPGGALTAGTAWQGIGRRRRADEHLHGAAPPGTGIFQSYFGSNYGVRAAAPVAGRPRAPRLTPPVPRPATSSTCPRRLSRWRARTPTTLRTTTGAAAVWWMRDMRRAAPRQRPPARSSHCVSTAPVDTTAVKLFSFPASACKSRAEAADLLSAPTISGAELERVRATPPPAPRAPALMRARVGRAA